MIGRVPIAAAVGGLACGAVLGLACADAGDDCGPRTATVARVIDGDTVELDSGERVRYLMVDTPETTNGKHDCFGAEAAAFNMQTVLGKTITLHYDEVCEDVYGRLLAYVEVGGRELNALLVERGYACVLHIPPNGDDRAQEFAELERAAKDGKVGLWGACAEVTCD